METVAEAVESSKSRSIPGWGQTGQGGVMRHRRVPSRHHIPPTVIHLEAGSRVALAGPPRPLPELRRPESGKERQCTGNIAGCHQEGSGGLQVLDSRGISTARRLQWVQPADTPFPRGTAAQGLARKGPTVDLVHCMP